MEGPRNSGLRYAAYLNVKMVFGLLPPTMLLPTVALMPNE